MFLVCGIQQQRQTSGKALQDSQQKIIYLQSLISRRGETDLSDCIDKLCRLSFAAADAPPVCLDLEEVGVAGGVGHEVAGVCRALRAPDAAEHGAQLCGVHTPGTRADEILGLR